MASYAQTHVLRGADESNGITGEHALVMGGLPYPIRHLVTDPNAIINDHERALHFAAHPQHVDKLQNFGSHRLAVLPGRSLWDSVKRRGFQYRCWHSNQCAILFCFDCEGVQLDVVTNPLFWHDLKLSPEYMSKAFIQSVWHQQQRLPAPDA